MSKASFPHHSSSYRHSSCLCWFHCSGQQHARGCGQRHCSRPIQEPALGVVSCHVSVCARRDLLLIYHNYHLSKTLKNIETHGATETGCTTKCHQGTATDKCCCNLRQCQVSDSLWVQMTSKSEMLAITGLQATGSIEHLVSLDLVDTQTSR